MRRPRPLRLLPAALLVLLPLLVYLPALTGGRVLAAVHPAALSPWRAEADPALLADIAAHVRPLEADKTLMFHPQLRRAQQRLAAGEAPLWNPDNLCGAPLLAQAVHGALSPANLLAFAMPPALAYGWIAVVQTALAGLFLYALLRELGVEAWPAALGGASFAFCGFLALRPQWFQIQGSSIWLPAALLGTHRALHGHRWGALALTALATGCSLLAGFPQASLFLLYACGALLAITTARAVLAGAAGLKRRALQRAAWGGAGLALGLALGAPQVLPSFELAGSPECARNEVVIDGVRREVLPEDAATLAMSPASLLSLVVPDLFGRPQDMALHETPQLRAEGVLSRLLRKPGSNAVETAGSIGLASLLLALLGLASGVRGRLLGGALLLAGVLCAIDTPLLPAVLHLPGLATGDPRRFLLLFGAGGALLAGLGLSRLLRDGPPGWFVAGTAAFACLAAAAAGLALALDGPRWTALVGAPLAARLGVSEAEVAAHAGDLALDLTLLRLALLRCAALAVACAVAALVARRSRRWGAALLCAAAAVDLLGVALAARTTVPAAGFDAPPPGLARLLDDDGGRLQRFRPGALDVMDYPLPPDIALPFGVRDVSGYITLGPRRVERLHELLQPGTSTGVGTAALSDPAALDSPLLDALAVTRVLSSVPLQHAGLSPLGRVGDAWLYRNDSALPRAFLAASVQPVARAALAAPGFDPHALTIVETGAAGALRAGAATLGPIAAPPAAPSATGPATAGSLGAGSLAARAAGPGVSWQRDEPERVTLAVECAAPATLVLCDSWMPGWTARVDGVPAPVQAANLAFRAVDVPAGSHVVEFSYRSRGWELGRALGLAALVLLLACLALAWRERRALRAAAG